MKYTIELDQEMLDSIFKQILVEDYKALGNDIKELKKLKKTKGLANYQLEDLVNDIKYRKALATAITYYFARSEAQSILGKRYRE